MPRPARCRAARGVAAALAVLLAGCQASSAGGADAGVPADLAIAPDASLAATCAALGLAVRPLDHAGPFGVLRDALADDFTLTDQGGEFRLGERWSGCDSYVFLLDSASVSPLDRTSIWTSDLDALVAKSVADAPSTHYFFISTRSDPAPQLALLTAQLDAALAPLPEGDGPGTRGFWRAHLHFVPTPLAQIASWVGAVLRGKKIGDVGFAIDRSQRLRGLGSLADVERYDSGLNAAGQWPWQNNLAYAAHPPIYFNYEARRDARIAAEPSPTSLTVFDHQLLVGDQPADVAFPDAATMATFDTFEIDLTLACPDAAIAEEQNNCGAWDYMIGVSFDAIDAQVVGGGGVPDGGVAPPKEGHEAARFVTTYHRAGSFTLDVTHVLPYLLAGGRQHMVLSVGGQSYVTTLTLRLRNAGKGGRPTHTKFLFWGGVFDKAYDANHAAPVTVPIPPSARRVELTATITGHGAETGVQCAEFCDHQHRFTVNGVDHLRDFPDAGSNGDVEGCLKQVSQGAVPNQSGTWWLGRGGWCPGMQVEPWIVDVSAETLGTGTATVTYQGLYSGKPPATSLGKIDMGSWLTIWE